MKPPVAEALLRSGANRSGPRVLVRVQGLGYQKLLGSLHLALMGYDYDDERADRGEVRVQLRRGKVVVHGSKGTGPGAGVVKHFSRAVLPKWGPTESAKKQEGHGAGLGAMVDHKVNRGPFSCPGPARPPAFDVRSCHDSRQI